MSLKADTVCKGCARVVLKPLTCGNCGAHMHPSKICISRAGHTVDEDRNVVSCNLLRSDLHSFSMADVMSTIEIMSNTISLLQADYKAITGIRTSVTDIFKKIVFYGVRYTSVSGIS